MSLHPFIAVTYINKILYCDYVYRKKKSFIARGLLEIK